MSEAVLLKKIEQCREEMIQLSNSYGINSEIVIQSSKKLDDLLNQYQNLREALAS